MGPLVLRRLLLVLAATAFVLATAVPGAAPAMPMPGGLMLTGSSAQPCDDCPAGDPARDSGTKGMSCGILACASGAIAVPAPAASHVPVADALAYADCAPVGRRGRVLSPDPFPPRLSFLG